MSYNIVNFLGGSATDDKGRYFSEVLNYSDRKLEFTHDFIQRVFPTCIPSQVDSSAPVISKEEANLIKNNPEALINIHCMYKRMMQFYGLAEFYDINRIHKWYRPYNHNLKRLTRIILALRIFGLDADAKELYENLKIIENESTSEIISISRQYWERAFTMELFSDF